MSPAPSTSDRDDAAKLQERVRRAKASIELTGNGAEADPEDLGEPIEIEGADEVLRAVGSSPVPHPLEGAEDALAAIVAPSSAPVPIDLQSWPLTNGLVHLPAPSEEFAPDAGALTDESGPGDWTPAEDEVALEVADGSARTVTATAGVVPAPGWQVKEFYPAAGAEVTAPATGTISIPATGITWRNSGGQAEVTEVPAFVAEPDLTPPAPPAVPRETATAPPPRTKRKIGIIGYTGSRRMAPYGDPEWELWGLNNLHLAEDIDPSKFDAWFDLHPRTDIVKDEVHRIWLEGGSAGLSCFVWGDKDGQPPADWPNAVAYPQAHILESFPPYFTNSISWMTALAITLLQQRADEAGVGLDECQLGVWGVDMATDGEYAAQRPSCEFYIGVAMGLGIPVEIPESSDLLKAASLYGLETSPMLAKIDERIHEITQTINAMSQAHAQHEHEARQLEANINAGRGALDQLGYLRGTWFQPTNAGNSTHESEPS